MAANALKLGGKGGVLLKDEENKEEFKDDDFGMGNIEKFTG